LDLTAAFARKGIPPRDLYELPSSDLTFQDGAHYRIELAGIERPSVFEAMLDEAERLAIPVHRIIQVSSGMILTEHDLRKMGELASDARIEAVISIGPRAGYDIGAQARTTDGAFSGYRLRGADQLMYAVQDVMRGMEYGFKSFNVADEGLLWLLNELRSDGTLPKEIKFKASIGTTHGNPAGIKVLDMLGADTINPNSDLTLPMIASARSVTKKPLSIFITNLDASGGFVRIYEAPEIVRVASPVYLKIEPGISLSTHYRSHSNIQLLEQLAREKVRQAQTVMEIMRRASKNLRISAQGCNDLTIPEPKLR
jgi:hypothetical protein